MPADSHPPRLQPAAHKQLDELHTQLQAAAATNIGFPDAADIDYTSLGRFLGPHLLNNLGDPNVDGAYPQHVKGFERDVVGFVADLLRAPTGDRWGYVTSGGTEGTLYALRLARSLHPGGIVYYSTAAHHSVANAAELLAMPTIRVRVDRHGEIDYKDLARQLDRHRSAPAIVAASTGTIMTEAVDDVRRIGRVLDALAIGRRFIHADAALSGIPLALLDPAERPGFDFGDGADAVVLSGHKFLGTPLPCAVVVVKASHHARLSAAAGYTGSPDTTITNSRSGLAVLALWYAIQCCGVDGLRARAGAARSLATYTHSRLIELGWPAHRHRHALTVTFPTPPEPVTTRWALASHNGLSHIVCVPGTTRGQIDAFLTDLAAARNHGTPPGSSTEAAAPSTGNGRGLLRRNRQPAAAPEVGR